MQPNNSIIVYRSQTEANNDYFWNQMVFPWIYDHGLAILISIAVAWGFWMIYNKIKS